MGWELLAAIFIKHMEENILKTKAKQSWAQRWRETKLITKFEFLDPAMPIPVIKLILFLWASKLPFFLFDVVLVEYFHYLSCPQSPNTLAVYKGTIEMVCIYQPSL